MSVEWLELPGVALIRADRFEDARGDFRTHLSPELTLQFVSGAGPTKIASAHNRMAGTIRGLHYQVEPSPEHKTVWCSSGAVHDVLVDLRPESDTFGRWIAVLLDEGSIALHVPPGVAHGYQTLLAHTVVTYVIQGRFDASRARTIRWDDPTLRIEWPLELTSISDRDRAGESWRAEPS